MRSRAFDSALFWGLFFGSLCIVAVVMPAAAATPENFSAKTTADYIALCQAGEDQANHVAAIHFCEGFASGAYQYYVEVSERSSDERFVCLPDPPPSRNDALNAFVAWTKANPDSLTASPVDSIFRFLARTYPCAGAAK